MIQITIMESKVAIIEYERRIIHGIPVNVIKGSSKTDGLVDLYTWNSEPTKFGKYNYSSNQLSLDVDAVEALKPNAAAWRTSQAPRSRAEIRTGR